MTILNNHCLLCFRPVLYIAIFATIFLCSSTTNAAEISLVPGGNGTWNLTANGLTGVSALDINLRYDQNKLPTVKVEQGPLLQGAISVINDQVPGTLRAATVTSGRFSNNGIILTISSASSGAELVPLSLIVRAADKNGQNVPLTVRNLSTANEPATTVATTESTGSHHSGSGGSTLLLPADTDGAKLPEEIVPLVESPVQVTAVTPSQPKGPPLPEKDFHSQQSIIATIEKLGTTATVGTVKAIFNSPAKDARVRQSPAVVLADGRSTLRLLMSKATSQQKPSIGVQGCRLLAVEDSGADDWQIDLQTQAESWPAKILLLSDKELVEFPIVVIPELYGIPADLQDDDLIPALDLNQDGKHTSLDDYLLIGNLLSVRHPLP